MLPGPGYGLSLVLNLQRGDYGSITEAAGARLAWNQLKYLKQILFKGGDTFASQSTTGRQPRPDGGTQHGYRHRYRACEYMPLKMGFLI